MTLGGNEGLSGVSHIIVDEVHERSVDSDFLLLELRELLHTNPKIRVVLMSATINQDTFVKYFNNAPVIEIPGFTHPVEDLYVEDVIQHLDYKPSSVRGPGGVKVPEDRLKKAREAFAKKGLSEDKIRGLEAILRSDRTDYQVSVV